MRTSCFKGYHTGIYVQNYKANVGHVFKLAHLKVKNKTVTKIKLVTKII